MTNNGINLPPEECERLVKQFPIGVYYLDFKTRKFRNPNSVILRYTGYTKEEFEDMDPSKLLSEQSYQKFLERLQKVVNKEPVPESAEFEIVTKEGNKYWVLLNSQWRYDGDIPVESFCVVTNITEQKRIEKQLQEALKRAQLYLDMAYNIFLALDLNGNILLINRAGCDVLGLDECFLIGQNWFDNFVPKSDRHNLKRIFDDSMKNGFESDIITYESSIVSSSGEERLIRWRNTVIRDDNNKITGSFSSGEDITEQKEIEDKLLKIWKDGVSEFNQLLKTPKKKFSVNISPPLERAVYLLASGVK